MMPRSAPALAQPRLPALLGLLLLLGLLCCAALGACERRAALCVGDACDTSIPDAGPEHTQYYPQGGPPNPLDVLFVIDNSRTMAAAQQRLVASFPQILANLRHPSLGPAGLDLHIGVISTDLGAGTFALPNCEISGGDGGKLQNIPRVPGCTPPKDPWIAYTKGLTNIPACGGDGAACVRDAFACIAPLGTQGCGFEAPLEAARYALDPTLGINPGFLRAKAKLLVIFLTDEDDCSARNPRLFNPEQQGLNDPLGPLTSFRCFEFGVRCDINDRNVPGPRKGCVPAFDWLHPVDDYIAFFEQLKPPGYNLFLAAIAGPSRPVVVGKEGANPTLQPSCKTAIGSAAPALRLATVVEALDGVQVPLCVTDYTSVLRKYAGHVSTGSSSQCLERPPLLSNGAVACHASVTPCRMPSCDALQGEHCDKALGLCVDGSGLTDKPCGPTCLDRVDCEVDERGTDPFAQPDTPFTEVPRCPRALFVDLELPADACGATCPCWRLVPGVYDCPPELGVTPLALQIMRSHPAEPGSIARLRCHVSEHAWSSPAIQQAPQHCVPP